MIFSIYMKKIFIFILLIIQSSCASLYFTEEYYFAMNDYKAWAVTIDGKDGMVSTRSYESQSFINARVIYQCEKDYGKKSSKKPKLFISKNWLKSLNKYEGGGTFSKINDGSNVRFLYKPVVSDYFPEEKHFVRLINAQGGWYINYIDSIHTNVKYRWNGEMLGNFPSQLYNRAWIKQGNEIMSNLNQEVKRRKKIK